MTSEDQIEALLHAAANSPTPAPTTELVARVLADAAAVVPPVAAMNPAPTPWFRVPVGLRVPVGGFGTAFALAACAVFGVFAGAGYADQLLTLPGLGNVLAGLTDYTDSTTPLESLSLLMSEG